MTATPSAHQTALSLFGATVRARRKALKLTQAELAANIGLSRSYIGEIENGQRNVTLNTLLLLAVALEVPPTALLEPFNTRPELTPRPKQVTS